jgi:membrane associated rhomboid family serine protease
MRPQEPIFFELPKVLIFLGGLMLLIEAVFSVGELGIFFGPAGEAWRLAAVQDFGFFDPLFDLMIERREVNGNVILRLFTHSFLHYSPLNAVFGAVIVVAIGNYVSQVYRPAAVIALFFGTSIFGACVYGLFLDERFPLVGAFTGGYGLIGAYSYIVWRRLGASGGNQLQAFRLIGILLAIQLVFGVFFGNSLTWVAELAGFASGFALSIPLAPGGWRGFVAAVRRD